MTISRRSVVTAGGDETSPSQQDSAPQSNNRIENAVTVVRRPLVVTHVIESLGSGGAEKLLYTNLKHFDEQRVQSNVVTVFDKPDDWADAIRALGVPVHNLGCRGLRDLYSGVARLRDWLSKNPSDLLHTHL